MLFGVAGVSVFLVGVDLAGELLGLVLVTSVNKVKFLGLLKNTLLRLVA